MELGERIQRLEDIESIKQLKARYFHACDRKQLEDIKDCFVEGKLLIDYAAVGQFSSREELLALFKDKACHASIVDMHHGHNAQVDWLNENVANATWDLYFFQINTEENTLTQLGGFYQDKFVKINGEWKIAETVFTPTSTLVTALTDGIAKVIMAGRSGES